MENNQTNNPERHDKDTHFKAQMQRVFSALYREPKTMLMVSIETGVLRAKWRKQDNIKEVKKGICNISKHRAGYFTTNPELVKRSNTDNL